jgi:hypothetical protein
MGTENKRYEIVNTESGVVLGVFEGITGLAAIGAMLIDAGCNDAPDPALVAREVNLSPFRITLGELAAEYGVPLEGDYSEFGDEIVEISHDEDGWHVGGPADLDDASWAPRDDAMAARLRARADREGDAQISVISVDEECSAEEWWVAAGASDSTPVQIREWVARWLNCSIRVPRETANEIMTWAASLPGWSDGPAHAPHPLIVRDVD